ncbi:MAG: hypothetical protein PVF33_00185 [Candidatus Latescibacterota bacterium]|jgi:hypothetical protein
MKGTNKGIVLTLFLCAAIAAVLCRPAYLHAEPDLLVYPDAPAEFRYDPSQFEAITSGHPDFDAAYQVGGVSLWDRTENRIAYEVFRAPVLTSITPSPTGRNEFVVMTNEFKVIVDGFCEYPRRLGEVCLRFFPDPPHASAQIEVAGVDIDRLIHRVGSVEAREEGPDGFFTGTKRIHVRWSGAVGIHITAYGDKNNNLIYDGGENRWSIYVVDNSVPVENTTWGAIKAQFDSR